MMKLQWTTRELLRVFKKLDSKVPEAARPFIAAFFRKWRKDFSRDDLKTMLLEWRRIDDLIGAWRLVCPKAE